MYTNPDEFSLAQSSFEPERFGTRAGAGRPIFAGKLHAAAATAATAATAGFGLAERELKHQANALNEGGLLDLHELEQAIGAGAQGAAANASGEVEPAFPVIADDTSDQRSNPTRSKARAGLGGYAISTEEEFISDNPGVFLLIRNKTMAVPTDIG